METLGAVLVSIGLVVGGLLLLAVLVRLTTWGARQEAAQKGTEARSPSTAAVSKAAGQSFVEYGDVSARPSRSTPGSTCHPAGRPGRTRKGDGRDAPATAAWFPGPVAG